MNPNGETKKRGALPTRGWCFLNKNRPLARNLLMAGCFFYVCRAMSFAYS